jgi:hypothetical protein
MPTRRFYRIALAHPLDGRMRTRVCRLCFDQPCASAVCEFTSASATTGLQSVQPQYRAPTELQTPNTFNTKHNTYNTKHRSKR